MNRNELRDALMGVDEQYLAHSSDFKAVSASFRRRRARKIGAAASVMGCAAVALLAASFGNLGKYKSEMLTDSVVEAAFSAGEKTPASTASAIDAVSEQIGVRIDYREMIAKQFAACGKDLTNEQLQQLDELYHSQAADPSWERLFYQEGIIIGEVDPNAPRLDLGTARKIILEHSDFDEILAEFRNVQLPDYMGGSGHIVIRYQLDDLNEITVFPMEKQIYYAKYNSDSAEWHTEILFEAASTLATTTQPNVSYPAVSSITEIPNEIVWHVIKSNGIENFTTAIAMSPEDSLFIRNYCFGSKYEIGTADCLNDYIFKMETGETIYYHSSCGTFNDTANERSYHVADSMRDEINEILDKYFLTYGMPE